MPRITAYLKTTDPGRISSVVISPVGVARHEQVKKKIEKRPASKGGSDTMIVADCSAHPQGVATVPVVINQIDLRTKKWKELGIARCCPLCWLIVVPPDGIELPVPKPITHAEKTKVQKLTNADRLKKSPAPRAPSANELQIFFKIRQGISHADTFDVYDVVSWTGIARTAVLKYLQRLVQGNEIEVINQGGGPGNRTIYQKKVLKKEI